MPRLESIYANLGDRLDEAKQHGWLGEVAAIETTMAAATQKLEAMQAMATQHATTLLGMPVSIPQQWEDRAQTPDPKVGSSQSAGQCDGTPASGLLLGPKIE